MPEGPSIAILREELEPFAEQKVISATGNAKIDFTRLKGEKIIEFKSWGKHFLICFNNFFIRIHLLMFGTYRINERKETEPRLSLKLKKTEINFYTCSVRLIEGDPNETYDWKTDLMSDQWDAKKVESLVKKLKNTKVCDALLNQDVFSGSGNIIKNEVLFRIKLHPECEIQFLPAQKLKELVKDAHQYSLDFYRWKKAFELKKHWQIYKKKECPRCKIKSVTAYLGKTGRLTCYCSNCQFLYKKGKIKNNEEH
jgi:endonuclease-8